MQKDCPTDGGHDPRAIFLMWVPAVPFIAIGITVLLYAAPGSLHFGLPVSLGWARNNPLLGGLVVAVVSWGLLAAMAWAFRMTSSDNANARSYSDLCQRLHALTARLQASDGAVPADGSAAQTGTSPPSGWQFVGSPPAAISPPTGFARVPPAPGSRPSPELTREERERRELARSEVESTRQVIREQLGRAGLRWVTGTGYVNLWTLMHRAEEALIEIDTLSTVITGAINDRMRVTRSKLNAESQHQLVAELAHAVSVLDPSALVYLGSTLAAGGAPLVSPPTVSETHVLREPSLVIHVPPAPKDSQRALGRATLRHVRWAVNDFRDSIWDSLVRTRNHLLAALTVTGLITYLLLVLATAGQMSGSTPLGQRGPAAYLQDPIVAGAVFYLVGAVVGLFNLLSTSDSGSADIDDYGLTMVRLLLTPVISGLAAVIGVFVVAMLPATFNGQVLSPPAPVSIVAPAVSPAAGASPGVAVASPRAASVGGEQAAVALIAARPAQRPAVLLAQASATATPTASTSPSPTNTPSVAASATATPTTAPMPGATPSPPMPTLDSVYNLGANRFGLVIAAAFGLTPSLLIGALKRVPDEYKSALSSTQSTGRGGA